MFPDGQEATLVSKTVPGRYTLLVGPDNIDVYVLREILNHNMTTVVLQ